MPRYFFDTTDADVVTRDQVGTDLPDDAAARRHAGKLLHGVVRQNLADDETHAFACDARNEAGLVIYRAALTYRGGRV